MGKVNKKILLHPIMSGYMKAMMLMQIPAFDINIVDFGGSY